MVTDSALPQNTASLALACTITASSGQLKAGGLSSYFTPANSANLLSNPGFESWTSGVPNSWTPSPSNLTVFSQSTTTYHSGSSSLQISGANALRYTGAVTQTLSLPAGTYDLTGWIMTSGLGATTLNSGIRLCPLAPPSYPWGLMSACSPVVSGTTSWTQYTLAKLTLSSASAVAFQIGLYNNPDGTAWVDDLVLTREQAPISVFMQYPNFKGMIFDDQSQIATFNIVPNPSQGTIPSDTTLSDYRIDGTVTTAGGGTVLTGSWAAASSVTATLDFSSLSESTQYNIAFQLTRISDGANASSNSPYPNYTVYKHPASARTGFNISADQNQRILYNGTPTFVLGAYDSGLGYTTSQSAWEGYLASNRRLFSLPINFYLNYWFGQADNSAIVPLVQDLQSHGIGYLDTANCSGNGPLTPSPFFLRYGNQFRCAGEGRDAALFGGLSG